ncbi:hypothetical protein LX36DRAFT_104104 [Colletotrichum falcatum]|nr:hypothetical protein LX36DRAFT_104104 [Colletotrichum falcatum]
MMAWIANVWSVVWIPISRAQPFCSSYTPLKHIPYLNLVPGSCLWTRLRVRQDNRPVSYVRNQEIPGTRFERGEEGGSKEDRKPEAAPSPDLKIPLSQDLRQEYLSLCT